MVDKETKNKFLEELEKDGIPYSACRRSGLSKATLYRILKKDKSFKKKFQETKRIGLENSIDIAQFALNQLIKEKNLGAIKWAQKHCDPRFRPRPRKVQIEHSNLKVDERLRYEREEYSKSIEEKQNIIGSLMQALLDTKNTNEDEDEEDVNE